MASITALNMGSISTEWPPGVLVSVFVFDCRVDIAPRYSPVLVVATAKHRSEATDPKARASTMSFCGLLYAAAAYRWDTDSIRLPSQDREEHPEKGCSLRSGQCRSLPQRSCQG